MASGHANRANRPNTWLTDQQSDVKSDLPTRSTHGAKQTNSMAAVTSAIDPKAGAEGAARRPLLRRKHY